MGNRITTIKIILTACCFATVFVLVGLNARSIEQSGSSVHFDASSLDRFAQRLK